MMIARNDIDDFQSVSESYGIEIGVVSDAKMLTNANKEDVFMPL